MNILTNRQQRTWAILGVSFFLALVFDNFFYGHLPGITIFLYTFLVVASLLGLAHYHRRPLSREAMLVALAALFFAGMTAVRESGLMTFFNVVVTLYLLLVLAKLSNDEDEKVSHYWLKDYLVPIFKLPLRFVNSLFESVDKLFQTRPQTAPEKRHTNIARGLLITVPVLVLFLLLFMSADLVFQKAITSVFDFHISSTLVMHLLLIGFIMAGFIGAFGYIFGVRQSREDAQGTTTKSTVKLGTTESLMLLGSLNILFLFFILIQFTYLFGGQHNVQGAGFTYAQYARKGFFELIAVALLTQVVLWVVYKKAEHRSLNHIMQVKVFSLALFGQTMIIMLSALKRLGLYEQAYGFTTLRFFSHLFIFWLAMIFILLAYQLMVRQKEHWFAGLAFLTTLAFLVIANLLNPDAFIARENINRYRQTGKIDVYYLHNLSADAVPEIAGLLNDRNPVMQKAAAKMLYDYRQQIDQHDNSWRSKHLSRQRARQIFASRQEQLVQNKDYVLPSPVPFSAD